MGDGNGWARCGLGHVHWGRFGAAGLLPFHREPGGDLYVLLQQRAWWCNGGGTWGLFGGGRHSHEDEVTAALRETREECTLDTTGLRVHGFVRDDHGGWDFTTVYASLPERVDARPDSFETRDAAWVRAAEVEELRLFAPFAGSWPRIRAAISRVTLVVDAANVVGSRPDGWWRDRAGAAARLRDRLTVLAASGLAGPPHDLPEGLPELSMCFPEIVLVVEGEARAIAAEAASAPSAASTPSAPSMASAPSGPSSPSAAPVTVVAAEGSGDDSIAALVAGPRPHPEVAYVVVTADRELRRRCTDAGAIVLGPRWLLDRLDRLDRLDGGGSPGRGANAAREGTHGGDLGKQHPR